MELKHVIPNAEKTFGNLTFGGLEKVTTQYVNRERIPVSRSYHLFSDLQRADDIIVTILASAGEKNFEYEQKVKLVSPKITTEGENIENRGYTGYILNADDLVSGS